MAVLKKRSSLQDRKAAKLLIKEAETKREQGEAAIAAGMLQTAIFLAVGNRDFNLAIEAIGHLIVCYLRSYELTREDAFCQIGLAWVEVGLSICNRNRRIPNTHRGMLYLRRGDFYLSYGNIDAAARTYREAVDLVGKKNQARYAEYLGHLGLSLALQGGSAGREGIKLLKEAEKIIRNDTSLREFHRLIVHSGILLRIARGAGPNNRHDLIPPALKEAAEIGKALRDKHGMPARVRDTKRAANELGFRV